jgi:hypothetical protein
MTRLFHVSETAGIGRFDPRPPPSGGSGAAAPVVWAVDEARLPNYLLPRDCPRVCFAAGADTDATDRDRFLPRGRKRVVAIEAAWLARVASCRLWLYEMPAAGFSLKDAVAGYWVTEAAVTPVSVVPIDDAPGALATRGVELRVLPSLWLLHDAVAASTLDFSMIRMRKAAPRGD